MAARSTGSHAELAAELRTRVLVAGELPSQTRAAILGSLQADRGFDPALKQLAEQVVTDSARVTDSQISAIVELLGSERRAFEVVFTAAASAGLARWGAADAAITGAEDASRRD